MGVGQIWMDLFFYVCGRKRRAMSYAKILQTLETRPLLVPHIALGMRKPGEETGIWLFGEQHDQEIPDVPGGIRLEDLFEDIKDTTVLLYEGAFPPGQMIFADAPPAVISAALRQTPADDVELLSEKNPDLTDLDEQGYNLTVDDDTRAGWEDGESYWNYIKDQSSYMEYLGQKFMSTGGVSINIDNKIRLYYVDTLRRHEEDDTPLHPDSFLYVLGWALHNSVTKPGRNLSLVAAIDQRSFRTKQTYMFFRDVVRSVDDRIHPITDFHMNILAELRMLLENEPGTDGPLMFQGPDYMRFANLFIFLTMDVNIHDKITRHADQNFVAYSGAAHTIGQYVALRQRGYILEHAFIAPHGQHFILPSDKRGVSHETFPDTLQRLQPSLKTTMLEFDLTHPVNGPCYRECIGISNGSPSTYKRCMDALDKE